MKRATLCFSVWCASHVGPRRLFRSNGQGFIRESELAQNDCSFQGLTCLLKEVLYGRPERQIGDAQSITTKEGR